MNIIFQALLTAIVAGLLAFIATPLTLLLARHWQLTAQPSSDRFHTVSTPVIGGLAMWLAVVLGLLVFWRTTEAGQMLALIISCTLVAAVGFLDDLRSLRPSYKMLGILASAAVMMLGGVRVQMTGNLWLDSALSLFWIAAITNALNLQDNMDGLAAGITATASGCFLILAVLYGQPLTASLAAALLGASLGFLSYNFDPAITFMGDTGSLLLGFCLAVLGIRLQFPVNQAQTWMVPILVLGLPIFDTLLVIISRWRRHVPFWQGGTDHTSHRLVRLGLSHRRAVLALYTVALLLGSIAILIVVAGTPLVATLVVIGTALIALSSILLLERVPFLVKDRLLPHGLRLTVIGGGNELLPVLEALLKLSRKLNLIITPGTPGEMTLDSLNATVTLLAENPTGVEAFLKAPLPNTDIANRLALYRSSLRLRANLLCNTPSERPQLLQTIQQTDLFIIAGNLDENILLTLRTPEIANVLRLSRRQRLLIHSDPANALATLRQAQCADVLTDALATTSAPGPWQSLPAQPNQPSLTDTLAHAISQMWLQRSRLRGLPAQLLKTEPT